MATQTTSNTMQGKTGINAGALPLNHHQPRHTLRPSQRHVHHGMLALVGRLVLLSVFLLVCGGTRTPAHAAQDPCAPYTGDAHRVCAAAVTAGCFAGVQSSTCNTLAQTWNEGCDTCEGAAPWGPDCPCNLDGLNAEALYAELESTDIGAVGCTYTRQNANVGITGIDWLGEYTPWFPYMTLHAWTASDGNNKCSYFVNGNPNLYPMDPPQFKDLPNITAGQLGACRKDIKTLIDQLNASPFFCGFQVNWGS